MYPCQVELGSRDAAAVHIEAKPIPTNMKRVLSEVWPNFLLNGLGPRFYIIIEGWNPIFMQVNFTKLKDVVDN